MAPSASAQLFVYEGFEYGTAAPTRTGADLLQGQADDPGISDAVAFGLSGTWNDIAGAGAGDKLIIKISNRFSKANQRPETHA